MHLGIEDLRLFARCLCEERLYELLFEGLETFLLLLRALFSLLVLANDAVLSGRHELDLPLLLLELSKADDADFAESYSLSEGFEESGTADGGGHDDQQANCDHEGTILRLDLE